MPYIKQQLKFNADEVVEKMRENGIIADGDLNYILFKYCKKYIKPSYNNYKNYIGELHQCIVEIERRILAPYEDEKIKENGDII